MKTLNQQAHEWVFETNGNKWSNNDDTAGDNYSSFLAGANSEWVYSRIKEAYAMGRSGRKIKEFNETFNTNEK